MQCGTPRGDHFSTEAGLQAPSIATGMDGPEAAPVREKGGMPVPAETVEDDYVMGFLGDLLSGAWRYLTVLDVHVQDAVWAARARCGDGGLHLGGQDEVSRQPQAQENVPGWPPGRPRRWGPVGNMIPLRRRAAGEGLVHGDLRPGGEVVGKGQDGHCMPLVQEDGSENDVAEEATEANRA